MSFRSFIRKWLLDDTQPQEDSKRGTAITLEGPPPTALTRQFVIHEALNGTYIAFQRRKYNPHGPDDFRHEVYIVKDGESLVDAISTVLVLTEK
jgi:hypothetical protein